MADGKPAPAPAPARCSKEGATEALEGLPDGPGDTGRLFAGTSGFSYADWVGPVYPPGTRKSDFLSHYSLLFNSVEINYTYYRMPTLATMSSLVDKSQGRICFTAKLTGLFTHERSAQPDDATRFLEAMRPLTERRLLGCLLAQFPGSFRPHPKAGDQIVRLREMFGEVPLVVEVRHRAWSHPRFFEFLRANDLGFCCVDQPALKELVPPLEEVTSATAYLRFHGRNADKWWKHDRPEERYDYRYENREMAQWVPRVKRMLGQCDQLFVFFNNHFEGKAVDNARQFLVLLSGGESALY